MEWTVVGSVAGICVTLFTFIVKYVNNKKREAVTLESRIKQLEVKVDELEKRADSVEDEIDELKRINQELYDIKSDLKRILNVVVK